MVFLGGGLLPIEPHPLSFFDVFLGALLVVIEHGEEEIIVGIDLEAGPDTLEEGKFVGEAVLLFFEGFVAEVEIDPLFGELIEFFLKGEELLVFFVECFFPASKDRGIKFFLGRGGHVLACIRLLA